MGMTADSGGGSGMVEAPRLTACKRDFQVQALNLLMRARQDSHPAEGIPDQMPSDLMPEQVLEDLHGMGTITSIHDLVRVFAQAGYCLLLEIQPLDFD